jgi:hypothetical protein
MHGRERLSRRAGADGARARLAHDGGGSPTVGRGAAGDHFSRISKRDDRSWSGLTSAAVSRFLLLALAALVAGMVLIPTTRARAHSGAGWMLIHTDARTHSVMNTVLQTVV